MATKPSPWSLDSSQVSSTWDPFYTGNSLIIPLWQGSGEIEAYENPDGSAAEYTGADLFGDASTSWISPTEGPAINPSSGSNAADVWEFTGLSQWLIDLPAGDHTIIVITRSATNDAGHWFRMGDGTATKWVAMSYDDQPEVVDFVWDDDASKITLSSTTDPDSTTLDVWAMRHNGANYEVVYNGTQENSASVNNDFSISTPIKAVPGSNPANSSQTIDSEIHAIYIVDSALTDAEIGNLVGDEFGPITQAADTTAPTLTNPTASQDGSDGYSGSVDTDEGNGTLYHVVTQSSTSPSAAQVKAGQDHNGSAADASGNQAVSATGTQNVGQTGVLSASTQYWIHYMHEDAAANQSTVSSSTSFTTAAAGANPPDQPTAQPPAWISGTAARLESSAYSETDGDAHASSDWQVDVAGGDFSSPVYEALDSADLEAHVIPTGTLSRETDYIYRVRHTDTDGDSTWSASQAFTTTGKSYGGFGPGGI